MTVKKVGAFLGISIPKNYICKVVFSKYTFRELYRQTEGIETFGSGLKGLQRQVTGCLWAQTVGKIKTDKENPKRGRRLL